MDLMKEGIGLRAYGQKDPLIEYKSEGYNLFSEMIGGVKLGTLDFLFRVQVREPERMDEPTLAPAGAVLTSHDLSVSALGRASRQAEPSGQGASAARDEEPRQRARVPLRVGTKVGRNEPCPCGSGKKYKKCCGA
jgi:preprotein translocase subunit SecA